MLKSWSVKRQNLRKKSVFRENCRKVRVSSCLSWRVQMGPNGSLIAGQVRLTCLAPASQKFPFFDPLTRTPRKTISISLNASALVLNSQIAYHAMSTFQIPSNMMRRGIESMWWYQLACSNCPWEPRRAGARACDIPAPGPGAVFLGCSKVQSFLGLAHGSSNQSV